jgi:hypothetical protein
VPDESRDLSKLSTYELIVSEYGQILDFEAAAKYLAYPGKDALRKARDRGKAPIEFFAIDGQQGWFATARNVADWVDETLEKGRAKWARLREEDLGEQRQDRSADSEPGTDMA